MRMPHPAVKLTYDDFVHFPDDGKRHELIDGEHHVTPSPNTKHQTVSMNLLSAIWGWLESHPIGRLYHAPFDVVFTDADVVEPDLFYISNERRQERRRSGLPARRRSLRSRDRAVARSG